MNTCEKSVKHFLQLRKNHNLSIAAIAKLLNFKSPTSITNFEKGRAFLSIDATISICNLFCVTSDWVIGRSEVPYTDESVALAEEILFQKIRQADKRNTFSPEEFLNPYYKTLEDRKENYSLAVRANIVFLIYLCHLTYIKELNRIIDIKESSNPIKKWALLSLEKDPNYNWQSPDSIVFETQLSVLINKIRTEPFYDITKKVA